jgi:hypothetical protein
MQLKENISIEFRSKIYIDIYIDFLENESTRLLFSNKHSEKINGNGIKERDEVDQAWIKIRINVIDSITEIVDIKKVNMNINKIIKLSRFI